MNPTHAILHEISRYSIEDGVSHPAQDSVQHYINKYGCKELIETIFNFKDNNIRFDLYDVIRILGRLQVDPIDRLDIAICGLRHLNLSVREATVLAIESWEDKDLIPLLKSHVESNKWLNDYIQRIIKDIQ
jgi:hypothetical protein